MTGATRESASALPSSKPVEAINDKPINPLSVDRSRLVLVDDDGDYREAVGGELTELGFDTVDFDAGAPMLDYFGNGGSADIVVLDWKLSGQTGLDLLRQLRRRGIQVPVVILTGVS